MHSSTTRRPPSLGGFFIAAAFVSGLGFLPMVWVSRAGAAALPPGLRHLQLLMLFGPALLAIVWSAREGGRAGVRTLLRSLLRWRVHPGWWIAALFGPGALYFLGRLLGDVLGASAAPLPTLGTAIASFLPTFGIYLLLNTEELAWRGYAWPRLRDRLGALRGSLVLGVVWGLLHAPLFMLKGGHPGGWPPALFLGMTVVFSVLFALAYEGTHRSVLIAHVLHQSLNAWGDAIPVYPRVTGSIIAGVVWLTLAFALAAIGIRRAGWRWRDREVTTTPPVLATGT
jgi:uncharacterized protein